MNRLKADQRVFFSLVSRAVLSNPFGSQRHQLDLQMAGRYTPGNGRNPVDDALVEVRNRIALLEQRGFADIRLFENEDRKLLRFTFLFDIFHRFLPHFDGLIADQVKAGHLSRSVNFAGEFIDVLVQRGFSHDDALRCFELCFQLRRAFFFIQQNLVGRSPCMRQLRESLWNNVFTHNIDLYERFLWNRMEDFSTLILGPTGAGKGTAAMAIGRSGYIPFDPKKKCFVESFTQTCMALNLSQYSPSLIESELFGHKKGAFTGAVDDYKGIFDRCSAYGAIFLDEIGEVQQNVQIKLLQIIQERTFTPVGSHTRHRFSGRVIAATNRAMEHLRAAGGMRDDFYYRLCSDVIHLPSLAQRIGEDPEELDDLVAHTVTRILGRPSAELSAMLSASIARSPGPDYSWPGNVRELEQCVRRIMLKNAYAPEQRNAATEMKLSRDVLEGRLDARGLLKEYCRHLYNGSGTYEAVARRTGLDRRTVKRYIMEE